MTAKSYISDRHPSGTELAKKRERRIIAIANHRAVIAGNTSVDNRWYDPTRSRNARLTMDRNLLPVLRSLAACIKYADLTDPETYDVAVKARRELTLLISSYKFKPLLDDTDEFLATMVPEHDGEKYVAALREACRGICNGADAAQDYSYDLYDKLHYLLNELLEILAPEPDEFEAYQKQLEYTTQYVDLIAPEPQPKVKKQPEQATIESLLKDQRKRHHLRDDPKNFKG